MVKFKKMIKQVGSGAKKIGSEVGKGATSLYTKYKEYQSPEAQQKRLDIQEKRLQSQTRIAKQQTRLRRLQPQGGGLFGGEGGFAGFQGIDMEKVLTGGKPPRRGRGKPFNPFSQI